jgi:hypothetical protein
VGIWGKAVVDFVGKKGSKPERRRWKLFRDDVRDMGEL